MIEHHLISVQTLNGAIVHGYLIAEAKDERTREIAYHKIFKAIDTLKLTSLNIILDTNLGDGKDIVEAHIRKHLPEAKALKNFKKICFVVWICADDDPDNKELMALH